MNCVSWQVTCPRELVSSRDQGYIQPGKCSVHVFFCFYSIHEFTVNNENSNYDGHEEGHKTVHAGG